MYVRHRALLAEQTSNLLVLSTLLSMSTAGVVEASAKIRASPPDDSEMSLPAVDAKLDGHTYQDRFSQLLKIQHTPPPTSIPAESQEAIEDEDEESFPHPVEANHRPVPTKWLMLGYSRVADVPTSLPTMAGENKQSNSPGHHPWNPSERPATDGTASCAITQGRSVDWMQSSTFRVAGALGLFMLIVVCVESGTYLWRKCGRRRTTREHSRRVALNGDEKQLRAFAQDAESI